MTPQRGHTRPWTRLVAHGTDDGLRWTRTGRVMYFRVWEPVERRSSGS